MSDEPEFRIAPRISSTGDIYICRKILRNIFNVEFVDVFPRWMISPISGRRLLLECFNIELRLGLHIEYESHLTGMNLGPLSLNDRDLKILKIRSNFKHSICSKNNVNLIKIPYWMEQEDYEAYINQIVKENYSHLIKKN